MAMLHDNNINANVSSVREIYADPEFQQLFFMKTVAYCCIAISGLDYPQVESDQ